MSAQLPQTAEKDDRDTTRRDESSSAAPANENGNEEAAEDEEDEVDEDDDEDDDDEEPKLKYAKLTGNLANVYRADSTSAFLVTGDKMVVGTHNGSIHVFAVPTMESLRTYRAHSATVTSVDVSPRPPKAVLIRSESGDATLSGTAGWQAKAAPLSRTNTRVASATAGPRAQQTRVPNTPNNQIYIASSSQDGHVCIQNLVDAQDVQLRNFSRPVNAVAMSPEYKTDRMYLSGGLAGKLILTTGGKAGVTSEANTNSAAAAASGWLGAIGIGLGGGSGTDTSVHSGEGAISNIKWSLSGKWVVWVNESGIKIMRTHLHLGSEQQEDAWKRIAHAAKPNRREWEDMATVWKARCEWTDEQSLESDELATGGGGHEEGTNGHGEGTNGHEEGTNGHGEGTNGHEEGTNGINGSRARAKKKMEGLVVAWGDTAWILHVHSGSSTPTPTPTPTRPNAKRQVGSADIIHKLQFRDCILSGIAFYTPSLLAILAYRTRTRDHGHTPIQPPPPPDKHSKPERRGRQHRHTALAPHLRLVTVANGEEVELDELSMSRYESLTAQDYHLGTWYMPPPLPEKAAREQRGKLEGIWDATRDMTLNAAVTSGGYATRIFSSSASVFTSGSDGKEADARTMSFTSSGRPASARDVTLTPERRKVDAHPYALEPGLKLFIHSPYDCVMAVKRELSDHLEWLLEHHRYAEAWHLIDEHPEAVDAVDTQASNSDLASPTKRVNNNASLADFFASDSDSQATGTTALRAHNSSAQKEKRRIGDLWLSQLVALEDWEKAGQVAGVVLGTSARWEHWVWTFAQANRFDDITPYIPSTSLRPPLPSLVYEVILGHYIVKDATRLVGLLDQWDPELFDVRSVISAIEDRLESGDVAEDSVEGGVKGRDWRLLMESLGKLYLADGRAKDALRCFVALQDAERAFTLIKEDKLIDAVADDVPGLLMLRVTKDQMRSAPLSELEEASSEAVQLLVDEAIRGTVPAPDVIRQLQRKGDGFRPFLFFYFRALWNASSGTATPLPRGRAHQRGEEGRMLVEDNADLAIRLFAEYDRDLLLTFLKRSEVYSFDKAAEICERRHYIPELVHIHSKTGQTRRALNLIIGELGDVKQAIEFAKENPDLWEDLLEYSMGKPTFIRGLLEEVGAAAAFNPIDVVRRIPEGLEIEGLKHGIQRLVREFEIQLSISGGVAKVLRGEVSTEMDTLRAGRKKGVRFEVVHAPAPTEVELKVHDVPTKVPDGDALPVPKPRRKSGAHRPSEPGCCVGCGEAFSEDEKETLIGFACGHVYHLSCLLDANPDTRGTDEAEDVLRQMHRAADEGEEGGYSGRSVGAKVAHAHIIGNVVKESVGVEDDSKALWREHQHHVFESQIEDTLFLVKMGGTSVESPHMLEFMDLIDLVQNVMIKQAKRISIAHGRLKTRRHQNPSPADSQAWSGSGREQTTALTPTASGHPNPTQGTLSAFTTSSKITRRGPGTVASYSSMARSSMTRERVIVRQSYYWPDWQLNVWIIIMLAAGGVLVGVFASFVVVQSHLGHLGIPWIMPFGITVGALTIAFIILMLLLIIQRRLLPGILIIGSFILLVLYITGLIETAIQLFGPAGDINSKCQQFVFDNPSNDLSINTLAWLEQNSICQSWLAAFSFWIIGAVFLVYLIVLASRVAKGGYED
ncbi:hypothetical protein AC579_1804 [Pseudocercospora musae]|uniref:Vps41 beta-propeller domain-containing protein n=1 Tax=Pseudocercospora musae TaxID=113226 RepID=A0A139I7P6_9PEZI|nr:hypothetical protein AC579_1804 [Pseudocercospora musae]